jgi:hypothetical protein
MSAEKFNHYVHAFNAITSVTSKNKIHRDKSSLSTFLLLSSTILKINLFILLIKQICLGIS